MVHFISALQLLLRTSYFLENYTGLKRCSFLQKEIPYFPAFIYRFMFGFRLLLKVRTRSPGTVVPPLQPRSLAGSGRRALDWLPLAKPPLHFRVGGKVAVAQHGGGGGVAALGWPRGRTAAAVATTQGAGKAAAAPRGGRPGHVAAVAGGGGPSAAGVGGRVDAGHRAGGGRRPGAAARPERCLLCARPGARTARPALPDSR